MDLRSPKMVNTFWEQIYFSAGVGGVRGTAEARFFAAYVDVHFGTLET